jgi:hypothetical protein
MIAVLNPIGDLSSGVADSVAAFKPPLKCYVVAVIISHAVKKPANFE